MDNRTENVRPMKIFELINNRVLNFKVVLMGFTWQSGPMVLSG